MGMIINIDPEMVWDYFVDHRDYLETNLKEVASNPDFLTSLVLGLGDDSPVLVAEVNGEVYRSYYFTDKATCTAVCEEAIADVITEDGASHAWSEYEWSLENNSGIDGMIDDRESEIWDAASWFVETLCKDALNPPDDDLMGEITNDVLECVLRHLSGKYDISIFRPMYVEDKLGKLVYEEYPYLG